MKKRNIILTLCLMIMSALGGSYAMYYFTEEGRKAKSEDKKEHPMYGEDELEMLDLDVFYED